MNRTSKRVVAGFLCIFSAATTGCAVEADEQQSDPTTSPVDGEGGHVAIPPGKLETQGGGFSSSCMNITLMYPLGPYGDNVELTATCANGSGAWQNGGIIHLDWILENNNGHLLWWTGSYGGYQNSCFGEYLLGSQVLGVTCYKIGGGTINNEVNLNDCIANYGGNLIYICG